MTGRELIKKIIDENGLDTEYTLAKKSDRKLQKAMKAKSLSEICKVSVRGNEIELVTEFPMAARRFGLSDQYEKYVWDGVTVYFHTHKDEPSVWSISYGGNSTTMVTDAVVKYRSAMVEEMVKQICDNDLTYPRWIEWRVRRNKVGGDIFSIFGKECADKPAKEA